MDVVVEVGGWEQGCCGPSIERDQLVDLGCVRLMGPDGEVYLSETHHTQEPELRVRGRVRNIEVARLGRPAEPVDRVPSGRALRGFDPEDDGHLETPWTGEILVNGDQFLVTVQLHGHPHAEQYPSTPAACARAFTSSRVKLSRAPPQDWSVKPIPVLRRSMRGRCTGRLRRPVNDRVRGRSGTQRRAGLGMEGGRALVRWRLETRNAWSSASVA